MLERILKLILSGGGVGNLPKCPGTAMSAVTVFILWFLPGSDAKFFFFLGVTLLGFVAVQYSEMIFQTQDPRQVVIDEMSGMAGSLIFLPHTVTMFAGAFVLFRIFDAFKPLGIRAIDRIKRPSTIMWDDLLAAVYTNLILQVAAKITSS